MKKIANLKRFTLVIIYLVIFILSVSFIYLIRIILLNENLASIQTRINIIFNDFEVKRFIFMLLTIFFTIAVFSTILMYMNYFMLQNPKFEKRVLKQVHREIKHLHRKRKKESRS